jgi:hypothetical protein
VIGALRAPRAGRDRPHRLQAMLLRPWPPRAALGLGRRPPRDRCDAAATRRDDNALAVDPPGDGGTTARAV